MCGMWETLVAPTCLYCVGVERARIKMTRQGELAFRVVDYDNGWFFKNCYFLFAYLGVLSLSCSTQDIQSFLRQMGSFLTAFSYGMWDLVNQPGTDPSPLRWEHSLSRWTTRELLTLDDFNCNGVLLQMLTGTQKSQLMQSKPWKKCCIPCTNKAYQWDGILGGVELHSGLK